MEDIYIYIEKAKIYNCHKIKLKILNIRSKISNCVYFSHTFNHQLSNLWVKIEKFQINWIKIIYFSLASLYCRICSMNFFSISDPDSFRSYFLRKGKVKGFSLHFTTRLILWNFILSWQYFLRNFSHSLDWGDQVPT